MTQVNNWFKVFNEFVDNVRINSKEIVDVSGEGAPLVLWESQKRFLKEVATGLDNGIHHFVCLKSRQLGVTTISLLIDIVWLCMHPGMTCALVTENEKNRNKNRAVLKQYIASLQGFLGEGSFFIVKGGDNRDFMKFSNGSRIDFLVAGTKNKGTSWGEGEGYAFVHATEVSAYGSVEGLKSFEEAFSQTNPNRLFIYESTAKGMNHFYDTYQNAKKDPFSKRAFFIGWWASKTNVISRKDPRFLIYSHEPSGEELEKIRLVQQLYDYTINPEQLAWIRWKEDNAGEDGGILDQNQPWCVAAETRVGTNVGIIRADEVREGMVTNFGKVLAAGKTGRAKLWKAKTKDGYELIGTANHPLINSFDAEVELKDSLGHVVRLSPPKFADDLYTVRWREGVVDHAVLITPELARLVGMFMGDGHMSGSPRSGYQFSIACDSKDMDVVEECHRLVRSLFGINTQENSYLEVGAGGWTTVKVTSKLMYTTFKALGLLDPNVSYSRRYVHVPDFIWKSPKHVVKEFLKGLFETDGHVGKLQEHVVVASKYGTFMRDVQLLLLGFGITCKALPYVTKKRADGKQFFSTSLHLRMLETVKFCDEIGFISERKLARCRAHEAGRTFTGRGKSRIKRIDFEDQIVEVVETDREEDVWNVSIDGRQWFDANGIITHNTDKDAFIQSGYSFFQMRALNKRLKEIEEAPDGPVEDGGFNYKPYRYELGNHFMDLKLVDMARELMDGDADPKDIELRIWEEPKPEGRYVIGGDPAYGRNDWKDRSAFSVWRCYADRLVQVAEFASNRMEVEQAAWILAHLCGAYRDVIANIELQGPGRCIMKEWDHLRALLSAEYNAAFVSRMGWEDAFGNARWYLYHRPDSMGTGYAANFEATWRNQQEIMHQLKNGFMSSALDIRSIPLLLEMSNVVQDGPHIGAPETSNENGKDDRVFAAALANRAWIDWRRIEMISLGLTFERVHAEEAGSATATSRSLNGLVYRFFRTMEERAAMAEETPSWRRDKGLE